MTTAELFQQARSIAEANQSHQQGMEAGVALWYLDGELANRGEDDADDMGLFESETIWIREGDDLVEMERKTDSRGHAYCWEKGKGRIKCGHDSALHDAAHAARKSGDFEALAKHVKLMSVADLKHHAKAIETKFGPSIRRKADMIEALLAGAGGGAEDSATEPGAGQNQENLSTGLDNPSSTLDNTGRGSPLANPTPEPEREMSTTTIHRGDDGYQIDAGPGDLPDEVTLTLTHKGRTQVVKPSVASYVEGDFTHPVPLDGSIARNLKSQGVDPKNYRLIGGGGTMVLRKEAADAVEKHLAALRDEEKARRNREMFGTQLDEAKATGKPVVIDTRLVHEESDQSSLSAVTRFAMPDGTITTRKRETN